MLTLRPMTSSALRSNSRSAAELKDRMSASRIDHDHGVGNGFQDRFEVSLACQQIAVDGLGRLARALDATAKPCEAKTDRKKCRGIDDIAARRRLPSNHNSTAIVRQVAITPVQSRRRR